MFCNRLGEICDRSFEQERYRASGLNLVAAAVVLWNTVHLERAVAKRQNQQAMLWTKIHDSKPVSELLDGLAAKVLLADKAYDSDKIVQTAQQQGMQVIIACRVNRKKNQRVLDTQRYKARHLVESLFQRMKVFRRVATRHDKLDVMFLGFVDIAGIMKWLN